jgi:1,5-anhydro-D-fructose reductase (1,5-anhydro-D-mannitol-forming)
MSTLRWGLVGASDIAATRVVPAIRGVGHTVVGVMSSSEERAQAYAQRHALEFGTSDLDALLGRDDIDAVYISTTNELHHAQALAAASAGKHILCEKPLAMTMADAWEMVQVAASAGVVLATNHHLPAAGTHRSIRGLVAGGVVGEVLAVRVFHAVSLPERLQGWRLTAPERGAGVTLDITCHDAAAVNAILDCEATEAASVAVRQGPWDAAVEDAVVGAIRYGTKTLVQVHDAFTVPFAGTGLEVHGTQGSIVARDVMTQDPVGRVVLRNANGEDEIKVADRRDLYMVTLEAFADAVAGTGPPIVDGVAGARALAVALAVQEAGVIGQTIPVAWDREAATTAAGSRRT